MPCPWRFWALVVGCAPLAAWGTGCAHHPQNGFGNDFSGWEFYRSTKVAFGSVVADGVRWTNPAPVRMYQRPDKVTCPVCSTHATRWPMRTMALAVCP